MRRYTQQPVSQMRSGRSKGLNAGDPARPARNPFQVVNQNARPPTLSKPPAPPKRQQRQRTDTQKRTREDDSNLSSSGSKRSCIVRLPLFLF